MRFLTKTEVQLLKEKGFHVMPWCCVHHVDDPLAATLLRKLDREKYMMPDGQVISTGPNTGTVYSLAYLQEQGILKDTVDFGGALRHIKKGGKVRRGDKVMFVRDNKIAVEVTVFAAALSNEDYMADDWEVVE